jgi:amidophosphoribosyltransferase
MVRYIGVDSLAYLSIDGLYRAVGEPGSDIFRPQYCDACFTGDYPIRLVDQEKDPADNQLSFLEE